MTTGSESSDEGSCVHGVGGVSFAKSRGDGHGGSVNHRTAKRTVSSSFATERREVLRRGLALGPSMPIIGYLLAACGGSENNNTATSAATTETGGTTATSSSSGGRQAPPQPARLSPERLIRGPAWSVTRRGMLTKRRATSIRRNGQLPSVRRPRLTQPDCWADQHGDPGVHCGSRGIGRDQPRRFVGADSGNRDPDARQWRRLAGSAHRYLEAARRRCLARR